MFSIIQDYNTNKKRREKKYNWENSHKEELTVWAQWSSLLPAPLLAENIKMFTNYWRISTDQLHLCYGMVSRNIFTPDLEKQTGS